MSLVADIKAIQRAVGAEVDGVFGPETAGSVMRALQSTMDDDAIGELPGSLDERTLGNIATLDPKARERFAQFSCLAQATAATFGCDYIMISGHRSWAEQDALFKQRPRVTHAKGGESNHNFGIAGDYGVFRGKSYLDTANPILARQVHAACAVHARKLGFEWGGDWPKLKDDPHYELSTGLTLAQKREVYQERGSVL